jgi:hypothetical protein
MPPVAVASLVWVQVGSSGMVVEDRQLLEGDGFLVERGRPKPILSCRGGTSHTGVICR